MVAIWTRCAGASPTGWAWACASSWRYLEEGGFVDLETIGGFRNLLVKLAIRRIGDASRQVHAVKRDRSRDVPLDEIGSEAARDRTTPSDVTSAKELEEISERALQELSDVDRR